MINLPLGFSAPEAAPLKITVLFSSDMTVYERLSTVNLSPARAVTTSVSTAMKRSRNFFMLFVIY